jgi:hypothetical protein
MTWRSARIHVALLVRRIERENGSATSAAMSRPVLPIY